MNGRVGDWDGWVEWEDSDPCWSGLPTLACGHFILVVSWGEEWSVPKNQCRLTVYVYDKDEDAEEVTFPRNLLSFAAIAHHLATKYEHPAPNNVFKAAVELWEKIEWSE